jgi:hypothetical protein
MTMFEKLRGVFSRKRSASRPPFLAAVGDDTELPDEWPSIQARLAAAHNEPIGPADITAPPNVGINPKATGAYEEIGRYDASHPGVDEHAGPDRPEQPSARAVRNSSRAPLDRLGERWEQIKARYQTGQLGLVPPKAVHLLRELAKHTWHLWLILFIVIGAGVTAELVYGVRAAALLTVADPMTALVGAIAFSFAMNGLAWYAAHLLFTSNQNVVRRNGTKFALGAAILIGILVSILALVVGGFDPIQMTTVEGGGAAEANTAGSIARWTLAGAYGLILTIVSASIAAGHLLILDRNTDLKVKLLKDAERKSQQESLDPTQQNALVISLAEAVIEAIDAAHRAGRHYVAVYNASFRRHAPVVIAELFADVEYDDQDPDWLPGLRAYL